MLKVILNDKKEPNGNAVANWPIHRQSYLIGVYIVPFNRYPR